ncbi:MAG: hypothetical protein J3Q66DRAFT_328744 [Benniella sp.]|nr:MAG: hypothetical protein J3Q66DRAFT_328744 [Benniella sp.]
MFKNIFNPPDSLRNALMGQDELRAKSQQGLQAVKSGVESLRTVLANYPVESLKSNDHRRSQDGSHFSSTSTAPEGRSTSDVETGTGIEANAEAEARTTTSGSGSGKPPTTRNRSGSGSSWSFLPPSIIPGRPSPAHSGSSGSNDSGSTFSIPGFQRQGTFKDVAGSFTDSVAVSIKNLGTGLKLGSFAEGFGLNGSESGSGSGFSGSSGISVFGLGSGSHGRKETGDSRLRHQQQSEQYLSRQEQGPSMSTVGGGQASKSRVVSWNGYESRVDRSGDSDSNKQRKELHPSGTRPEQAAKEIAALLAKQRKQQFMAMERARRMPEVEKMAQRYHDTWTEIHSDTARNSERADAAEEILMRAIEFCIRHAKAATQLEEEGRDLIDLDKSLDEMTFMAENIQKKLVGLESAIERLEDKTESVSLEDWKRAQVVELYKYMDMKRDELWDKAELLSTRSKQFQKEEAARKLRLYQNQFDTDMAHYRKTQDEREQELWKIAEAETNTTLGEELHGGTGNRRRGSAIPSSPSSSSLTQDAPRIHSETGSLAVPTAVLVSRKEEERRELEDLDRFLGPASESDSKEEDNDDDQDEDEDEDEDEDDEDSDEDEDEDEESSEDDLDPIAMARKARAAEAMAAAKRSSTGTTISAFSALANHPSTTSLSKP